MDSQNPHPNHENNVHRCSICAETFKTRKQLENHMRCHADKRQCKSCGKSYRLGNLRKHQKLIHGIETKGKAENTLQCDTCGNRFKRLDHLQRHIERVHRRKVQSRSTFSCRHCESEFTNYEELFEHVTQNHPLNQQGGRQATTPRTLRDNEIVPTDSRNDNGTLPMDTVNGIDVDDNKSVRTDNTTDDNTEQHQHTDESIFNGAMLNRYLQPRGSERYDMLTFLGNVRDQVRLFLEDRTRQLKGIKWNLCIQVEMERSVDELEAVTSTPYFRSLTYLLFTTEDDIEYYVNEAMQKIFASLEKYIRDGSGWWVKRVLELEIHTVVYNPLSNK